MELQGTQTQANLIKAFSVESEAGNKYTFYAKQAKKDGFEQISALFHETAHNEHAHAKVWFETLHGGMKTTTTNLSDAITGEKREWSDMYEAFATTAQDEGLPEIADLFKQVAKIEKQHEARFKTLLNNLNNDKVFTKDQNVEWECRNCGHTHNGKTPPEKCPVCSHPKSYFQVKEGLC